MRAFAMIASQGEDHIVGAGDLVGRAPTAAIIVDDPRISEAHAMFSVRKGELHLLSLRRLVIADGAPVSELRLRPGLAVTLADELVLVVKEVVEPAAVLAVVMPSGERQVLPQVASLTTSPPRLHGRIVPEARAQIWSLGDAWRVRTAEGTSEIEVGSELVVDGARFGFVAIPLASAGMITTNAAAATAAPLKLVAFYDAVHIYQRGRKVHTLGGVGARILSELVACGGPVHWEVVAREIWRDRDEDAGDNALRHRWDVALGRLRTRLRHAGVRELVTTDGTGQIALETYTGDILEDRT